jgi:PP-loop superfamily ATP-utilizing enzyme
MEAWNTWSTQEEQRCYINNEPVKCPITSEKVKEFAQRMGLANFIVKDSEGRTLTPSDFPYSGRITIEAYNKAA